MAEPLYPSPAKLFTGILYREEKDRKAVQLAFEKSFGSVDCEAGPFPFQNTGYYDEIGTGLQKYFFSLRGPIEREKMPEIKLFSNRLEASLADDGRRRVNIDPGYLTLSNVFLASCKDYYHRVYLGRGVYLENEYRYNSGSYDFWPWTYPDYKQQSYLNFFYKLRSLYHKQLKEHPQAG